MSKTHENIYENHPSHIHETGKITEISWKNSIDEIHRTPSETPSKIIQTSKKVINNI